jgi:tetratricopeptide (TPR) repeat protein
MAKKESTKPKEVAKPAEPATSGVDSGIVVGDTKSVTTKRLESILSHKRLIAIGVLVLILVIASGTMAYVLVRTSKKSAEQSTAEKAKVAAEKAKIANSSYTDLSQDEINQKIKTETGLTKEQLSSQKIDASTYKSFDTAYSAAKAYYGIGDYQKAVLVYAQAYTYASSSTSYVFYLDYADAADGAGDANKAVEMIKKAIEAIKNSTLSNDEKSTLTEKLQQKIDLRALGN